MHVSNWLTKPVALISSAGAILIGAVVGISANWPPSNSNASITQTGIQNSGAEQGTTQTPPNQRNQLTDSELATMQAQIVESNIDEVFDAAEIELAKIELQIDDMQSKVRRASDVSGRLRELADASDLSNAEQNDLRTRAHTIEGQQRAADETLALIKAEGERLGSATAETQELIQRLETAESSNDAELEVRAAEIRLQAIRQEKTRADQSLEQLQATASRQLNALNAEISSAATAYERDINHQADRDGGMSAEEVQTIAATIKVVVENLPEIVDGIKAIGDALYEVLEFLAELVSKLFRLVECLFKGIFAGGCGGGAGDGGSEQGQAPDTTNNEGNEKGGKPETKTPETEPQATDQEDSESRRENQKEGDAIAVGVEDTEFDPFGNFDTERGDVRLPTDLGTAIDNVGASYDSTGPDQRFRFHFTVEAGKTFRILKLEIDENRSAELSGIYTIRAGNESNTSAKTVVQTIADGVLIRFVGLRELNENQHQLTFEGLPAMRDSAVKIDFNRAGLEDGVEEFEAARYIDLAVALPESE